MSQPSPELLAVLAAFLGGYVDQGELTSITLDCARQALAVVTPAGVTVDGMIVSRLLRRVGFHRSYLPEDKGTTTYRKVTSA